LEIIPDWLAEEKFGKHDEIKLRGCCLGIKDKLIFNFKRNGIRIT